jgi:hypothetical protein
MAKMKTVQPAISDHLLSVTGPGGRERSRRHLSPDNARNMVRVREARRAFKVFRAQCFWYLREDLNVTLADIPEIADGLRRNGGRKGFLLAARLCR